MGGDEVENMMSCSRNSENVSLSEEVLQYQSKIAYFLHSAYTAHAQRTVCPPSIDAICKYSGTWSHVHAKIHCFFLAQTKMSWCSLLTAQNSR